MGQDGANYNNTIECRNIDQLENEGEWVNISFIHDGISPTISTLRSSGDVLIVNSSVGYSCTDYSYAETMKVEYEFYTSTLSNTGTVILNGSQPSITNMNLNQTSNAWINYYCVDYFDNVNASNVSGMTYLATSAYVDVNYAGDTYVSPSGVQFVTSSTDVIFGYNSNQNGVGTVNLTILRNGSIVGNWTTNSSQQIALSNLGDGSYVLQYRICSTYYCANTTEAIMIDSTKPSDHYQSSWVTLAKSSNGTLNVGKSTSFGFRGGFDGGSRFEPHKLHGIEYQFFAYVSIR